MGIRFYSPDDQEIWDRLVEVSWNGTFLHTRRFLSYHGDHFEDRSLLILGDDDQLLGVMPASIDPHHPWQIISHPGLTYGGIVHEGGLGAGAMLKALELVCDTYRKGGFTRLLYKATPYIYHRLPAQDDLYALFRMQALRVRCDLASSIDLLNRGPMSRSRKQGYMKAQKQGLRVVSGDEYLEGLWRVLNEQLQIRHGATPVHSLAQIQHLIRLFPENIRCLVALWCSEVVAGIVLFVMPTVTHVQYSISSQRGRELSAADLIIETAIQEARAKGHRYFDYGSSNEDGGWVLNNGLARFKAGFGASGTVLEHYQIDF